MSSKHKYRVNLQDIVGKKFGRLLVLEQFRTNNRLYCRCRCDCGKELTVLRNSLIRNKSRSCGCLKNELTIQRFTTHKHTGTRTFRIWLAMRQRCYCPSQKEYSRYGGRGITVCKRWRTSFQNFLTDMGECPEGYSIDRINSDGNYEPGNCRWADAKTQGRNTSTNVYIEHNGQLKTIAEVAETIGMNYRTLYYRIFAYKWTPERAINTPVNIKYHRKTNPWKKEK